jgi:hypothetical protein
MLNNIGALQAVLPSAAANSSSSSSSSSNTKSATATTSSDAALISWAQRLQGEADAWTEALARSECNKVQFHNIIKFCHSAASFALLRDCVCIRVR